MQQRSYRIRFAEDVNGVFLSSACDVEFRRLSTKSSVLGKSNENYLTQWKWYWKRGDNDWSEYKNGVSDLFLLFFENFQIFNNKKQIVASILKLNESFEELKPSQIFFKSVLFDIKEIPIVKRVCLNTNIPETDGHLFSRIAFKGKQLCRSYFV